MAGLQDIHGKERIAKNLQVQKMQAHIPTLDKDQLFQLPANLQPLSHTHTL